MHPTNNNTNRRAFSCVSKQGIRNMCKMSLKPNHALGLNLYCPHILSIDLDATY